MRLLLLVGLFISPLVSALTNGLMNSPTNSSNLMA